MLLKKEIESRVKFNPGLSANRPSNNWALIPNCSFYDDPAMVYDMIHRWSMLSFYVVCFSGGK